VNCIQPGAASPEDLMACADGEASPAIVDHVQQCAACAEEVASYTQAQRRLRHTFYRMNCPSAAALGDYDRGLVSAAERVAIASHVVGCPRCTEDLHTLRMFLASTPDRPEPRPSILNGLRRILATPLIPLQPSYDLRGGRHSTTRSYLGGTLTIEISQAPELRRGRFAVTGLVWQADNPEYDLAGTAQLTAPDGTIEDTPIDASGSFSFEYIGEGAYELLLRLPREIVVVEDLRVGS
jgi:hypothetical protein